ncbi:MAG TPA: XRE family transcriptional regulator [Polyangia bacterium]|jgi:transcriptional regulator with XRE-family HTH domain|nr:XRE family transcriptional regulator [Polyangia bacterium]
MATSTKRKAERSSPARSLPLPPGDELGAVEVARRVGDNLRRRRKARNLSLDELAVASGVSRAALSQIETSKGNPTVGVLWKIAVGLGIPFAELIGETRGAVGVLRRVETQVLRSADGKMESRPLTPAGAAPWAEVYELRLAARATHASEAHAPGTRELVIVLAGQLKLRVDGEVYELGPGDSVSFSADKAHLYENPGAIEARYHDIILYDR